MPPHFLNLYQKPAIGTAHIRRYQAYNYRHKIAAVGWFDTASCDLLIPRADAERWLDQYLGNRVAFYVDNPAEPIWEGLVNRITYQVANVTFTASLDKLYNRVQINHSPGGANTPVNSTATNNTDSQAVYGIKQGVIDAKIQYTANGSTLPNALRDLVITQTAWPRISTTFGAGNMVLLSLELVGFYHTLEWEIYASATNTAAGASTIISEVVTNLANGTTFFDNADTSGIATNAAFNQNRISRNGQTAWQFMQAIQETGDGSGGNYYVMGIEPTSFNAGDRRFYYRAANASVEYTVRLTDGMKIRNLYGGYVHPWRVVPDRGIRLQDVLVGWNGLGDDPREAYIELVEYDAESQSVSWTTSDNIEMEGAFQLRRMFKAHNERFGAPVRQVE